MPRAGGREIMSANTYKATIESLSISGFVDGFQQASLRDTSMFL